MPQTIGARKMQLTQISLDELLEILRSNSNLIKTISTIAVAIVAPFTITNLIFTIKKTLYEQKIQKRLNESEGSSAFTSSEIHESLKNYIVPDCSVTDPSNDADIINVADVRETVFDVVARFVKKGGDRRHILLLADSGMGKTTFCLNFYARLKNLLGKESNLEGAIVSAGRPHAEQAIKNIKDHRNKILLLDAFDEDTEAVGNSKLRLANLMNAASDFAAVIVTCRSQFFENDAAVPDETGVSVIHPRRGGESSSYKFYRLYLMPFSPEQVKKYIKSHFPLLNPLTHSARKAAEKLISEIPELSVRPMLLALIPDLAKEETKPRHLYELYTFMLEQWLDRESKWISKEKLREVSMKVAIYMITSLKNRVTVDELDMIAAQISSDKEDWKHLKDRSLLNRDGKGLFKFSHRSIMEFLFVKAAIEGQDSCFDRKWTEFMREIFISWGQSDQSEQGLERADTILNLDLRSTEILPLQSALPSARQIPLLDFDRLAKFRRQSKALIQIPAHWRKHSLRLSINDGLSLVYDLCYDLRWEIVHTKSNEEYNIFRQTMPEYIKRSNSNYKLPSIEQFISLVESESQFKDTVIVDKNERYWIGDITSKSRSTFATFSPYKIERSIRKIMEVHKNASLPFDIFFYDFDQNSKEGTEISAMIAGVISGGAEAAWHDYPLPKRQIKPTSANIRKPKRVKKI